MEQDINLEDTNLKLTLKTKLSFTIAIVVILTVALISLLSNFFVGNQFKNYIKGQQDKTTSQIINNISSQYDETTKTWNVNSVHTIGMNALYDGYIIKVYDLNKQSVWDAETSDMDLCIETIDTISNRMTAEFPDFKGEFKLNNFQAFKNNELIGTISIGYYGPYFLSDDDFYFLDSLNQILIGTGIFSLIISIITGFIFANQMSRPIINTMGAAKRIAEGDYGVRIKEQTNTKEINDLINSINHLAESIEGQEMLRRGLTADMAHELRTPLTSVQTHIEAMIEGVWEPTTVRLQSCYEEMTRITKLVSDMENLAKLDNDNLKLKKMNVNLLDILMKIISNFETEFTDKNQEVSISGNCTDIFADRDRISQVLINLLSNASKYTQDGGKILINISETDDSVKLSINDNGIGIREDEISFIFERFFRGDKSRNRATGGTGIGLSIVKSIITAHEGSVTVKSELGVGSEFTVTLPKNINT